MSQKTLHLIALMAGYAVHTMPKQPGEEILDYALKVFSEKELAALLPRQFEDFVLLLNDRINDDPSPPTVAELANLKALACSEP